MGRLEVGWPRLVLLRHGATVAPPGVYLGSRDDPPLSARGVAQARRAGVELAGRTFQLVLVSPLRRAGETVALAMPATRPTVERRLEELDMGDFSGLTWEQIKAADREAALRWRAGGAAPGGEDAWQLWRRTIELGLELADGLAGNEDALLVAHSGPIRALIGGARGRSPSDVRSVRVPHGGLRCIRLTPAVLERWRALVALEPPG
ncbi:MAG TPA: histidine phosphatase family protein [Candidatus Saccharimonadales bacterium]|nr:histidine phosphatase family protein [Candidatus Saccharimonadales bacterium]